MTGERRPVAGWREPLTAAGEAYYCDAQVGAFSLQAFRPTGHARWSWDVRASAVLARSEQTCASLDAAKLAAEDACAALLDAARAVLRGGV